MRVPGGAFPGTHARARPQGLRWGLGRPARPTARLPLVAATLSARPAPRSRSDAQKNMARMGQCHNRDRRIRRQGRARLRGRPRASSHRAAQRGTLRSKPPSARARACSPSKSPESTRTWATFACATRVSDAGLRKALDMREVRARLRRDRRKADASSWRRARRYPRPLQQSRAPRGGWPLATLCASAMEEAGRLAAADRDGEARRERAPRQARLQPSHRAFSERHDRGFTVRALPGARTPRRRGADANNSTTVSFAGIGRALREGRAE